MDMDIDIDGYIVNAYRKTHLYGLIWELDVDHQGALYICIDR